MIDLHFSQGRCVVHSLTDRASHWLAHRASETCRFIGPECVVDPRFVNEFVDAAAAAQIRVRIGSQAEDLQNTGSVQRRIKCDTYDFTDTNYWFDRAREMRTQADVMQDANNKEMMARIADDYDRLGRRVVERRATE